MALESEGLSKDEEVLAELGICCGLRDFADVRFLSLEVALDLGDSCGNGTCGDGGNEGDGILDRRLGVRVISSSLDSSPSETGAEAGSRLRLPLRRFSFRLCPGPTLLPRPPFGSGGGSLESRMGLEARLTFRLAFLLTFRECAGVVFRECAGVFHRDWTGVVAPLGEKRLFAALLINCFWLMSIAVD